MPTIQSKIIELLNEKDSDDQYSKYEKFAKLKLYQSLIRYSLWDVKRYHFTEHGLYIKIQKDDQIKRFGFYPITYGTIYLDNQTFILEDEIPESYFYTPMKEYIVLFSTLCATGFYNEFGSY
jgi:hypothetical protein